MDDEVEITDVDDGRFPQPERGPVKNQDLGDFTVFAGELLSVYGWYLLAATVLVYFLILHLSKKRPAQASNRTTGEKQDADFVAKRQEAVEAARRRMQEELDAKALLFKEKQQQQEEERRKQKIESWESMQQGKSYKAKLSQPAEDSSSSVASLKPKTDKKPLRSSDYNPLAGGGGGSCSWRPGRRGPSSGG
ncbi:selenoprotein S [Neosynchiropus ocellatus]